MSSSTTVRRLLAKATEGFDLRMLTQNRMLQDDIRASLDETGRWHQRDCPLKADLMMSFALLMGLHRSISIVDLVGEIVDLLRDQGVRLPAKPITPEAVIKARQRLGEEPVRVLFERRAAAIDPVPSFHGLRNVSTTLRHPIREFSVDHLRSSSCRARGVAEGRLRLATFARVASEADAPSQKYLRLGARSASGFAVLSLHPAAPALRGSPAT